jgi:hypothetical protein
MSISLSGPSSLSVLRGESRKKSTNERRGDRKRSLLSEEKNESATQDYLERDVANNFLLESKLYRGFFYMLKKSNLSLLSDLRESLFPKLAIALEAVLHRAVKDQLRKEACLRRRPSTLINRNGKSFRSRPVFPDDHIDPSFDAVKALAEELKKANACQRQKEALAA